MTVSFHPVSPSQLPLWAPLESPPECSICLSVLTLHEEKSLMAHPSEEKSKWIHFVHEQCLKKWIEVSEKPICPLDRRRIQYPVKQGEQEARDMFFVAARALTICYFITWAIAEIEDSKLKQIIRLSAMPLAFSMHHGDCLGQGLVATMWTVDLAKKLSLGPDDKGLQAAIFPITMLWAFIIMSKARGWRGFGEIA